MPAQLMILFLLIHIKVLKGSNYLKMIVPALQIMPLLITKHPTWISFDQYIFSPRHTDQITDKFNLVFNPLGQEGVVLLNQFSTRNYSGFSRNPTPYLEGQPQLVIRQKRSLPSSAWLN